MENQAGWYILTQDKYDPSPKTVKYNVSLTIPKFKLLIESDTMLREFSTPCTKYTVIQVPDTQFQLKLCFLGRNIDFMEIYISSTSYIVMRAKIVTQGTIISEKVTKVYKVQENEWCFLASLDISSYSDDASNTLCLNCEITVWKENINSSTIQPSSTTQLINDYEILFNEGIYFDATIKSANGVEFRVHKNVLAVRSKVMKAHFEHQTVESVTNVVETAWETEVLRDLLTFVYTGNVKHAADDPAKLLAAADYYELKELKDICETSLNQKLTVENAVETLQLADLHSVDTLKEYTLKFINNGKARLITETEGWANAKPEIVKMIYEFITAHEKVNYNILAVAAAEVDTLN